MIMLNASQVAVADCLLALCPTRAKAISVFIAVGLQSLCVSLFGKKWPLVQKEIVLNDSA